MTFATSTFAKSLAASVLAIAIPIALDQSNLSSAFAGFVGGATSATVVTQYFNSRKQDQKKVTKTVENPTTLVLEKEPIDISVLREQQESSTLKVDNNLISILEQKGIKVLKHRQAQAEDEILDQIAIYLGKRYALLEKLQNRIKVSISNKTNFAFNLYGKSQEQIQVCTQYCNKLYRSTLLSHYHYDRRKKIIRGNIQRRGDIIQFLNGGWFERAILHLVKDKFAQAAGELDFLVNPQLEFTNGDRFELDILFLVDKQLFWIECKTGNHYNDCLPKYCSHGEKLGVAKKNAFLVGLGLSDRDAEKWTKLWTITVVNPEGLLEKI